MIRFDLLLLGVGLLLTSGNTTLAMSYWPRPGYDLLAIMHLLLASASAVAAVVGAHAILWRFDYDGR